MPAATGSAVTPLRLRFRSDAPDDRRLRNASFRHRVLTRVPLAASAIPGYSEIVRAGDVGDADEGIDVVIWQRPGNPRRVERLRARSRARLWVADLDDLLFASPESSPATRSRGTTIGDATKSCERYRETLACFDHITVSTQALAEAVVLEFPRVQVGLVLNGVPENWRRHGRLVYPMWKPGDARILRYLPGTSSHDADFAVVGPVLERLLTAHREIQLEVIGPLRFSHERFPRGRVRQFPVVPYQHLPQYLATSWVTIAPLEDNAFNRCKSSIKFMEAAAFGCPCVATPIPDMQRHVAGGVQLVADAAEWTARLEALLDDGLRTKLSALGLAHVARECAEAGCTRALVDLLRSWLPA